MENSDTAFEAPLYTQTHTVHVTWMASFIYGSACTLFYTEYSNLVCKKSEMTKRIHKKGFCLGPQTSVQRMEHLSTKGTTSLFGNKECQCFDILCKKIRALCSNGSPHFAVLS